MGGLIIKIISYESIDHVLLAKYILLIGVLIIIFSYVKLSYITYMDRTMVNIGNGDQITFKYFVFKFNAEIFGPYDLWVAWTFFTAVVSLYLLIGLITSGGGLAWLLELTKETKD
ncbi:MAG: hypothetical protein EU539_06335 [Promethearchaeota archaeon]|nr:MAG: hypothetical protein EU539_06335 [Candidatus Lokiarchaeota archaeon]